MPKIAMLNQEGAKVGEIELSEAIFASELPLANKLQLSNVINEVADIGDIAEDFIDELLIFTIKRDI